MPNSAAKKRNGWLEPARKPSYFCKDCHLLFCSHSQTFVWDYGDVGMGFLQSLDSCADLSKPTVTQVLELRERRLDHEETLGEVQKATDEHKRNLDRQVRSSHVADCANLVVRS